MKNIIITAIVLFFFLNSACKKESQSQELVKKQPTKERNSNGLYSTMFGLGTSVCDGSIDYIATSESHTDTSGNAQYSSYYDGVGIFYDNPSTGGVNVGSVSWGSIVLPPDSTRYGRWAYEFNTIQYTSLVNQTQFGSKTTFNITGGSGYSASSVNMYVPEEIYLVPEKCMCSSPPLEKGKLPKTIFWNQDPNNLEGVVIMIEYNGFRSNLKNSSFSSESFFEDPISAPDNGKFDITSSMLVNIPLGSIVTIHIGRANQDEIVDGNGKVIAVSAIAHTQQDYNYVP